MNFNNKYNFSDFKGVNTTYNRNTSHYIGLNRISNKKQKFFFQPNQMNVINSAEYQNMPNKSNIYTKNNLNKSTDITYSQTVNTSQIRQRMAKLNNDIKKLNGLFQQKSKNNLSENKNNSFIISAKKSSNFEKNYVLLNERNPSGLNNYQKLNQTYKINNNINKNYYITYDMKKMKFNINNNNVNTNNNYSDNELFKRKFSQSTHGKKNNFKNYAFSNKSDFKNNNYELNNYENNNQFYKSSSLYRGINNNKNNYGINVKGFSINENNNNEYEENNIMNYNVLKKNLLVQNNNQIQKRNYSSFTPSRKYNNTNNNNNYNTNNKNIFINNNNQNTEIKSNIFEKKNIDNNNNPNINNKNTLNNADYDDDELSELADEFIEAFNIDIINEDEIQENLKKNKSSNIYYNNSNDYFSKNDFQEFKSRSKEISMNFINNKSKTSPQLNENKFLINSYNNSNPKNNNEIKEIKPFNESIQLDESLIHDSQLDIPLILETLIYNKVMKGNNKSVKKDEKIIEFNKKEKNILNDIEKINLNKNEIIPLKIEDLVNKQKYNNDNIFESNKENKEDNNDNNKNINIELKNIKENNNIISNKEKNNNQEEDEKNEQVSKKEEVINNPEEDNLVNQFISKLENKEKSKTKRHIEFKLENNIYINFKQDDYITNLKIRKATEEEMYPFERNFNLYQKILNSKLKLNPSIKKFDKAEIKTDVNYKLCENLEEKDIIPDLIEENDEDIKSLEKSLERSIDKSFDKNYERSLNTSVNQSNNQSINQSYNQSMTQSYMENSFRNSGKIGNSTGGGLIQKLNKMFDINEDKSEYEENENEQSQNEKDDETNKDKDVEDIEEKDEETNKDKDVEEAEENEKENGEDEKNEDNNEHEEEKNEEEEEQEQEQEQEQENEESENNVEQQEINDDEEENEEEQ